MTDDVAQTAELVSSYGFRPPVGSDPLVDSFDASRAPPSAQSILVGELHHRLQNMLTIVMALSRMTARSVDTMDEFQIVFGQRIEAMARTNALMLRGQVQAVNVKIALETELQPYLGDNGQVTLQSDSLEVSPDTALSLSLIFHELATNAAKYGALSKSDGRLVVQCRRDDVGAVMHWHEFMAAPIASSAREGSGSLLISRLARSLGGTSRIQLHPGGLEALVTFRLGDG